MAGDRHFEDRAGRDDVKGPSEKSFGLTFAGFFALLTGLQLYRHGVATGAAVTAVGCLVFLAAAYLAPGALRPLNILWGKLGLLLHKIVNPVIMGVLFFGVFTPMGAAMRLFGADLLKTRRGADVASYWVERATEDVGASSMKNQF